MTFWTLTRRSLRFHARAHFGVVLGAAIGSAALIGALVVGDSVRESLRERALRRVASAYFAMAPSDRVFSDRIAGRALAATQGDRFFVQTLSAALLAVPGAASLPSGSARANHAQVFGVGEDFWKFVGATNFGNLSQGGVVLNEALAGQLGVHKNDEVILRVQRAGPI